ENPAHLDRVVELTEALIEKGPPALRWVARVLRVAGARASGRGPTVRPSPASQRGARAAVDPGRARVRRARRRVRAHAVDATLATGRCADRAPSATCPPGGELSCRRSTATRWRTRSAPTGARAPWARTGTDGPTCSPRTAPTSSTTTARCRDGRRCAPGSS